MSGYDYDCGMYGPDGHVYQIDYAQKAAESRGLGIGIKVKDGVAIVVQRQQHSALEERCSTRIFKISKSLVIAVIGIIADGRVLCEKMQDYCRQYEQNYARQIPLKAVVDQASSYMQQHTHYSSARPFGCVLFVTDGQHLY